MGKTPTHKNKGKRGHKLSHKTARRAKSLSSPADLIYAAFHVPKEGAQPPPQDEDLPGMGQFYCDVTGRHFENAAALARHLKTKAYKKQLRLLTHGPAPHVQADAEQAAGCGRPDNGPRLRGGDAMG